MLFSYLLSLAPGRALVRRKPVAAGAIAQLVLVQILHHFLVAPVAVDLHGSLIRRGQVQDFGFSLVQGDHDVPGRDLKFIDGTLEEAAGAVTRQTADFLVIRLHIGSNLRLHVVAYATRGGIRNHFGGAVGLQTDCENQEKAKQNAYGNQDALAPFAQMDSPPHSCDMVLRRCGLEAIGLEASGLEASGFMGQTAQ
jgi:hypothetical protein